MQYTEQQKQDLREEFRRRRRRQWMIGIPILALLILKFVKRTTGSADGLWKFLNSDAAIWILMAFILFALVLTLKNWRCPACHSHLGRDISPNFCPKCGFRFEEDHA